MRPAREPTPTPFLRASARETAAEPRSGWRGRSSTLEFGDKNFFGAVRSYPEPDRIGERSDNLRSQKKSTAREACPAGSLYGLSSGTGRSQGARPGLRTTPELNVMGQSTRIHRGVGVTEEGSGGSVSRRAELRPLRLLPLQEMGAHCSLREGGRGRVSACAALRQPGSPVLRRPLRVPGDTALQAVPCGQGA